MPMKPMAISGDWVSLVALLPWETNGCPVTCWHDAIWYNFVFWGRLGLGHKAMKKINQHSFRSSLPGYQAQYVISGSGCGPMYALWQWWHWRKQVKLNVKYAACALFVMADGFVYNCCFQFTVTNIRVHLELTGRQLLLLQRGKLD